LDYVSIAETLKTAILQVALNNQKNPGHPKLKLPFLNFQGCSFRHVILIRPDELHLLLDALSVLV